MCNQVHALKGKVCMGSIGVCMSYILHYSPARSPKCSMRYTEPDYMIHHPTIFTEGSIIEPSGTSAPPPPHPLINIGVIPFNPSLLGGNPV